MFVLGKFSEKKRNKNLSTLSQCCSLISLFNKITKKCPLKYSFRLFFNFCHCCYICENKWMLFMFHSDIFSTNKYFCTNFPDQLYTKLKCVFVRICSLKKTFLMVCCVRGIVYFTFHVRYNISVESIYILHPNHLIPICFYHFYGTCISSKYLFTLQRLFTHSQAGLQGVCLFLCRPGYVTVDYFPLFEVNEFSENESL